MTKSTKNMLESEKGSEKVSSVRLIWNFFVKSKTTKAIGGSVLGGGGVMALMIGFVNAQDAGIRRYVDQKDRAIREVVELKHQQVLDKIGQLDLGQGKILAAFGKLDQRMYEAALRANRKSTN